ncbi:MAG TPA: PRC-barrel domain-containing protein [Alphaproteobacteria bacterium]|nr:PRC-barrel domain-containing protein [Alphaproteobacteria bacterium]
MTQIDRILRRAGLALSLAGAALTGPVLAAGDPAQQVMPQMPTGKTEDKPGGALVREAPDQVVANDIIGERVYGPNGQELGEIVNLLVNRDRGTVDLVVIEAADAASGRTSYPTIAWASLAAETGATPRYVTDLTAEDLRNGQNIQDEAQRWPGMFNYTAELKDRAAVGTGGEELGEIEDIVVRTDGQVVAIVVQLEGKSGILDGIGGAPRAIAWEAAKPKSEGDRPVQLAVNPEQAEKAPPFDVMAPEPGRKPGQYSQSPRP